MGMGDAPLLAHIHVPKTAGSSLRRMLDKQFGRAHLRLYVDFATTFVYETRDVEELVRPSSVKAFSSHYVRRFPATLAGRPVHYVTFLRDPVEQFISYLCHVRKYFNAAVLDPDIGNFLPPDMPTLGIRESARFILGGPDGGFRNFHENHCTNFFARYPILDEHGFDYADPRYRGIRLKTAQDVLSKFLWVGITERMEESMSLLRRHAQDAGIEFPYVPVPMENFTADQRQSMDWIHPDDEVGAKLLESVSEDLELYRWALNRFGRR